MRFYHVSTAVLNNIHLIHSTKSPLTGVARVRLIRLAMSTIIISRDSKVLLEVFDLLAPLSRCLSPTIQEQEVWLSKFTALGVTEANTILHLQELRVRHFAGYCDLGMGTK